MGALRIPDGPRGLLCWPPLTQWEMLIDENRARVATWEFDVAGVPGSQLRAAARKSVLALAAIEDEPGELDRPLIVTGHQPQFYHPGIWMKAYAVKSEAERLGGYGINLAVDHDAGELAAEIPWRDGAGLHVTKQYLVQPQAGRPLETLPAPTREQVEQFIVAVEERLATLGEDVRLELWRTFADSLRSVAGSANSAADVGWRSRVRYEQALGYELIPDLPVSRISGTREFLLFFVHWVINAKSLLQAYNRALAEFRTIHGVRSMGNPFPDLLVRPDGAVELPFWGLTEAGIRRKLYVESAGDGDDIVLTNLEGVFARLPARGGWDAVDALLDAGVQVRPRAVPLTVYHRLFVGDLFIHGTGGARYDEVTDGLIRHYFGIEPPQLAVVSATLHLPFSERPVQPSALRALRHKLRDLVWNPQRYAWEAAGRDDETDEQLATLLREKERLINEIGVATTERPLPSGVPAGAPRGGRGAVLTPTGSRKRDLTRAIESTNARLYELLADVVQATEAQLDGLTVKARSGETAARRTYPFFLHDPGDMWQLLRDVPQMTRKPGLADRVQQTVGDRTHEGDVREGDEAAVACCGVDC